jgi:peptidoglycan/LPS O-acetylase OafA/YrhL
MSFFKSLFTTFTPGGSGLNAAKLRQGSPVTLRVLAALLVFHSHHFAVHGRPEPAVPGLNVSWGGFAVLVFFALSGYYVTLSYLQRPLWQYLWARFLRIFPALVVNVLFCMGLGAVFSPVGAKAFWGHAATWQFLRNNTLLGIYPLAKYLPGVWGLHPLKMMNASLWTLPYEWFAYLCLPLLWIKRTGALLTPVWIVGMAAVLSMLLPHHLYVKWGYRYDVFYLVAFIAVFMMGGLLSRLQVHWHGVSLLYVLLGLAFAWAVNDLPFMQACLYLLIVLLSVMAATRLNLDQWSHRVGDPSYGIYLYAFPLQQVTYALSSPWGSNRFWGSYAVALAATVVCGLLSWHLVEKPLLRFKQLGANQLGARQKAQFVGLGNPTAASKKTTDKTKKSGANPQVLPPPPPSSGGPNWPKL